MSQLNLTNRSLSADSAVCEWAKKASQEKTGGSLPKIQKRTKSVETIISKGIKQQG